MKMKVSEKLHCGVVESIVEVRDLDVGLYLRTGLYQGKTVLEVYMPKENYERVILDPGDLELGPLPLEEKTEVTEIDSSAVVGFAAVSGVSSPKIIAPGLGDSIDDELDNDPDDAFLGDLSDA